MSELKETVKVCEGLYSGSIYELETWVRTEEQSEWTKENLLRDAREWAYTLRILSSHCGVLFHP